MPTTIIGASGIDNIQDGVVGTNDLANNAVTTAKVADANITAAKLETLVQPLGVGQSWVVNGGGITRAKDTTYTNTTGRPITVFISWNAASGGGNAIVGGVTIAGSNGASGGNFTFVVPNGATYSSNTTGGTWTINVWAELR
jgi:hypothetical protein